MKELIVRIKYLLNCIKLKTNIEAIKIGEYFFNFTKQILDFPS
jgi:hypothetical protein